MVARWLVLWVQRLLLWPWTALSSSTVLCSTVAGGEGTPGQLVSHKGCGEVYVK